MKFRVTVLTIIAVVCTGCGGAGMVKRDDLLQMRAEAARAYSEGDMDKAGRLFKRLTERVPGEGEYWFRLGNVYARTHRPEEAVRCYREALVRQPGNAKAWHNMGIVHLRQAGNAFTQLIAQLPPEDPLYTYFLSFNDQIIELLSGAGGKAGPVVTEGLKSDAVP